MIFCSGAVSHLDTFDYKPELIKRDGQPLPGDEKLVTFQGENGNLVEAAVDVQAARAERQDDLATCCRTSPNSPTRCASSTR